MPDAPDFQFDANVNVDVGVNFDDIEDAVNYAAVPNGSYLAQILGFKGTKPDGTPLTNVNGKKYIEVHMKRLSQPSVPAPAGSVYSENFRDRLYLPSVKPGASGITPNQWFRFKMIASAAGKPWVGGNFQTAPMVGARVVVDVVQRPYMDKNNEPRISNDIKAYSKSS